MESSKEHIEAQLCAYVDGELNPAERAEIERHLAANPQHKSLIEDLRRVSGLLQDLPRVKAPAELNEALCGQLERSALLNDSEERVNDSVLSINRWPQITAVAAVLLLALGLGIVVYYVLPASGVGERGPLAEAPALKHMAPKGDAFIERQGAANAALARPDQPTGKTDPDLTRKNLREFQDEGPAAPPAPAKPGTNALAAKSADAVNRGLGLEAAKKLEMEKEGVAANRPVPTDLSIGNVAPQGRPLVSAKEVIEARDRITTTLGTSNSEFKLADSNSLYLVVTTPNAQAAGEQVAAYLKRNDIKYLSPDAGAPPASDPTNGSSAYAGEVRQRESTELLRRATAGHSKVLADAKPDGALAGPAAPAPSAPLTAAAPKSGAKAPDVESQPRDGSAANKLADEKSKRTADRENDALAEQSEKQAPKPSAGGSGAGGGLTLQQTVAKAGSAAGLGGGETHGARAETDRAGSRVYGEAGRGVIVARMNRRQANELSAALSRERGQWAELKDFAPSPVVQAAAPLKDNAPVQADKAKIEEKTKADVPSGPSADQRQAPSIAAATAAESASRQLKDGASGKPGEASKLAATKPAEELGKNAARADKDSLKTAEINPGGPQALRLAPDPQDEPVDVVIVLKDAPVFFDGINTEARFKNLKLPENQK